MESQGYIEHCLESYCNEKDKARILKYKLDSSWEQINICGDIYPGAKGFLLAQKDFWHNLALQDLANEGFIGKHFGKASYFLVEAEPKIKKHYKLKEMLAEFYNKTVDIGKTTSILSNLIMVDSQKIIFPRSRLEYAGRTFLESSLEDLVFLDYYKQRAEISWQLYAGFWPNIINPVEGDSNMRFYTNVSDFMLCMIDGISELEKEIKDARDQKINSMRIS